MKKMMKKNQIYRHNKGVLNKLIKSNNFLNNKRYLNQINL